MYRIVGAAIARAVVSESAESPAANKTDFAVIFMRHLSRAAALKCNARAALRVRMHLRRTAEESSRNGGAETRGFHHGEHRGHGESRFELQAQHNQLLRF